MLYFKEFNLEDDLSSHDLLRDEAQCLVNTVNCEGFMGKGIAYEFSKHFPKNNEKYQKACEYGDLKIGEILLCEEKGKIIANFPTKYKWREKSKISHIERGLQRLAGLILERKIQSIALPPLGCGNGGLSWDEVKTLIKKYFGNPRFENIHIKVYAPPTFKTNIKINKKHFILILIKEQLEKQNLGFNIKKLSQVALLFECFLAKDTRTSSKQKDKETLAKRSESFGFVYECGEFYSTLLKDYCEDIKALAKRNELKENNTLKDYFYRNLQKKGFDNEIKKYQKNITKAIDLYKKLDANCTLAFHLLCFLGTEDGEIEPIESLQKRLDKKIPQSVIDALLEAELIETSIYNYEINKKLPESLAKLLYSYKSTRF